MKTLTLENAATIKINFSPIVLTNQFELNELIEFRMGDNSFLIEPGFVWDGASIPRFAWLTTGTPSEPGHLIPSLIHDFLYQNGSKWGITRKMADIMYRQLLKACGKGFYTRWKEYWVLRVFGGPNYARQ